MTYAEHEFNIWESIAATYAALTTCQMSVPDDLPLTTAAAHASAVVDAINEYQPVDFQPGRSWERLEEVWHAAPKSHARTLALASLSCIRRAIASYQNQPHLVRA